MKEKVLYMIVIVVLCALSYAISYLIFNAVVNSDLSPFWKWIFLH